MSKRKNGEGSWGKKKIKGVDYKYYRKQYDGTDKPKYFYGKTEKEIKEKIKDYENNQLFIIPSDIQKICFVDYLSNWLYNTKQLEIKRRTFDGYEDTFKNQIKNYKDYDLAGKQIGSLSQDIFQEYYNSLSKKYSKAAIHKNYVIINQCLQYAEQKEDIKVNFARYITLPSEDNVAVKKKEIPFLSQEDMEKLYQESKRVNEKGFNFGGKIGQPVYGNNAYAIILIMYTGLRIGELLGLKWENIDIPNKMLYVKNNLSTIKNRNKKKETDNNYIRVDTSVKTASGIRSIPLYDRALEMIEYFNQTNPNHKPSDYICLNKELNIIGQRNITRTLNAMLTRAKCNVDKCGLHSIRHSFGSYLILQGADIKAVSKLLGHSDITVTYNIYIHLIPEQYRDTIDLFDNMKK